MIPNRFNIIYYITKKEMYEHFKTMRLMIISIIFVVVFFIVMFVGHYLVGGTVPVYKRGANEALSVLLSFSSLFPPILAIALGYNTIVGERSKKSLHLIVSKPVDRSSIYIGKFLGAFLSISFIYVLVCTIGYIVVIGASGKVPSSIDVGRAYAAIGILLISVACWILFVMLFSTSFKTVTSTLIFSIMFWLFIMNLASNAGLIYFMMTRETDTVAIDIFSSAGEEGSDITNVMFYAHTRDEPVFNIEYQVINETGDNVVPIESNDILQLINFFPLSSGNYTWNAYEVDTNTDTSKLIQSGSFSVSSDFNPFIQLTTLDDDNYYNDVLLVVGTVTYLENEGYDLLVTSTENNEIIIAENDYSGPYFIQNISEGDYEVEITKNGTTYFKNIVHSYGTSEGGDGFGDFSSDDNTEFPDYVRYTFVINPDNSATVSYEVLSGGDSLGIITLGEGLTALFIELFVLLFLGLCVFSKIELL